MKKPAIVFVMLLWAAAAGARNIPVTENLSVERDGDTVRVTMNAEIKRRSAPSGITLIHAPIITDGTWKVSLPPIVVQGRQAAAVWQRHEWAADSLSRHSDAILAKNGGRVDYAAAVPFQHWMHGARLEMETVAAGCADTRTERSVLAGMILPPPPEPEPEPEMPVPTPSVGQLLAETFSFVLPASEFDPAEPVRFYDDERDNALTLYYRINSYEIDPLYAENRQTLINLMAAVETISKNKDVHIERIVIAGFASPEGPFTLNDRLAWERAVSIKEYIMQNGDLSDETIMIFNGSLDRRGLRRAVAADRNVPLQRELLEIIDSRRESGSGTWSTTMNRIRTLDGGRAWTYLAERIFPMLRNGTFIRVYFDE